MTTRRWGVLGACDAAACVHSAFQRPVLVRLDVQSELFRRLSFSRVLATTVASTAAPTLVATFLPRVAVSSSCLRNSVTASFSSRFSLASSWWTSVFFRIIADGLPGMRLRTAAHQADPKDGEEESEANEGA